VSCSAVAGLGEPGGHRAGFVFLKRAVLQPASRDLHHLARHLVADRQEAFDGVQDMDTSGDLPFLHSRGQPEQAAPTMQSSSHESS
jgi:hypothetical protein